MLYDNFNYKVFKLHFITESGITSNSKVSMHVQQLRQKIKRLQKAFNRLLLCR